MWLIWTTTAQTASNSTTEQFTSLSTSEIIEGEEEVEKTPIEILMPTSAYTYFNEKIKKYAEDNDLEIKITTTSKTTYRQYLESYFANEENSPVKFNAFFMESSNLPNFFKHLKQLPSINARDEYETLILNRMITTMNFGVTLGTDFNVLYYRNDIINRGSSKIASWEHLIDILHAHTTGNNNNNNRSFDNPSCIPRDLDNSYLYNLFYSIYAPMVQSNGTREGIFFHKKEFAPLVQNFAFQLALETINHLINPTIQTIREAREKFLNGDCILLIDSITFATEILDHSSDILSSISVSQTPGARNVYYREIDQLLPCVSSYCIYNSDARSSYNYSPYIYSSLLATSHSDNSRFIQKKLNALFQSLSDSYSADPFFLAPYRPSQLLSPSWRLSPLHQLNGFTEAITKSLAFSNNALDLRVPYNYDFADSLLEALIFFVDDHYLDPFQTSKVVNDRWNEIIDRHPEVNFQRFYSLSFRFDSDLSFASSPSSIDDSFNAGYLAAIISVPIAAGSVLFFLLICIVLLLIFIAYSTHRRRKYLLDEYQPAWAIDFDEIELKRKIGAGSFGDVYQGIYRGTNVAVKIPRHQISDKTQFIEFFDEISIMRDLRHPNVLLFMGARIQSPNQCIVTEYMPRGSLYDILHDDSIVLDWMLIQTMALDAAQGMDFLHNASPPILHRDFKSPNLLVDKKWNLKVADFGLTQLSHPANNTRIHSVGSIFWTAPEVLQSPDHYTKKSDVYSYGIVLWELLTRSDPYQGMNPMYVALAVCEDHLRPDIPSNWNGAIVQLLRDCWHADPSLRPSFAEIRERLEEMELPFENNNEQENFSVSVFTSKLHPSSTPNLTPPKGFITFLFTDIKGYTSLWEENPTIMHKAIQLHNQIIRYVISEYNGYEVKSDCDSFMIAFQDAEFAIIAASSIQEEMMKAPWPKALLSSHYTCDLRDNDGKLIFRGLRLRIGINSGAAYSTTDIVTRRADYFGNSVNRAAQVTGMCEGGEILLTPVTMKQLGDLDHSLSIFPHVHFSKSHLTIGSKNKSIYRVLPLNLMKRIDYYRQLWNEKQTHHEHHQLKSHSNNVTSSILPNTLGHSESSNKDLSGQPWVIDFHEIQLGKKIGTGNFGEVYKGNWKGSDVAVKKFFKQQASEQLLLELRKESVIMSQLRHPNILLFLGACTVAPNLCIVTEYLKYGSVAGILHNKSLTLPFPLRVKYLKGAARGMCYLHGCKPPFIHRDLTTYNLLVGDNNTVKIGDFGLSRIKENNATMTLCGTAAWTAPEILQGLEYSEKSDIYSFGIIMWECYTRKIPFKDMDMIKISKLVTKGARPMIPSNCPEAYQSLMTSCWQTNPELRPTFDVILSQLKEIDRNYRTKNHSEKNFKQNEIVEECN